MEEDKPLQKCLSGNWKYLCFPFEYACITDSSYMFGNLSNSRFRQRQYEAYFGLYSADRLNFDGFVPEYNKPGNGSGELWEMPKLC